MEIGASSTVEATDNDKLLTGNPKQRNCQSLLDKLVCILVCMFLCELSSLYHCINKATRPTTEFVFLLTSASISTCLRLWLQEWDYILEAAWEACKQLQQLISILLLWTIKCSLTWSCWLLKVCNCSVALRHKSSNCLSYISSSLYKGKTEEMWTVIVVALEVDKTTK